MSWRRGAIYPPHYGTDGCHIYPGKHSYINMGATLLKNAPIHIGAHVMIGPNVQICTATHALEADERVQGGDGIARHYRREGLDRWRRHPAA